MSSAYETLLSVYDDSGLLVSASNSDSTYTFDYDDNGRLTHVVEPFGVSRNYAYDDDGRQTQVVDSFGGTQVSVYDLENRLTRRTYQGQGQELRVDYTHDALSRIERHVSRSSSTRRGDCVDRCGQVLTLFCSPGEPRAKVPLVYRSDIFSFIRWAGRSSCSSRS